MGRHFLEWPDSSGSEAMTQDVASALQRLVENFPQEACPKIASLVAKMIILIINPSSLVPDFKTKPYPYKSYKSKMGVP